MGLFFQELKIMLILNEFDESNEIITESKDKDTYIKGIFAQAELKNRNGRSYPLHILEREVNRYKEEYVDTHRAIGELCHPQSPSINPDRTSHLITELYKSGNDFIGKAKILNTQVGQTVKALIDGGVKIGVSTRGLGSISESNGVKIVNEDFKLLTVDIVTDPSGINCFVDGIVECDQRFSHLDGKAVEVARKKIMKTPSRRLEEEKLKQFEMLIRGEF